MADLAAYHWLFLLAAAPCVGSFLGVLVARLPEDRPVVFARSACPHCGVTLGWRNLIPIFSWVVQGSRCHACGARLSWRYPAIELAALVIAAWSLAVTPGWIAWAGALLGWSLLVLTLIDLEHLILPNEITLPLIPAGLAVIWAIDPSRVAQHALGAAAGFVFVVVLRWVYGKIRGREGIGLGDAKLLAVAGAWVSWEGLPGLILLAAVAALAVNGARAVLSKRVGWSDEFPFGPFLAAGLWLTWLYGPISLGGSITIGSQ